MGGVIAPTPVPLLGGSISGGEGVVIDSFDDLAAIRALCESTSTLRFLFEQIRVVEPLRQRFQHLRDGWVTYQSSYQWHLAAKVIGQPLEEIEEIDLLRLCLGLAEDVWAHEVVEQDEDRYKLSLLLAVADAGGNLELESEEPALIWTPGSLLSIITVGGRKTVTRAAWVLALARSQGVAPAAVARNLVEDLRAAGQARLTVGSSKITDLKRLDQRDLKPEDFNEYTSVVIFLHGLLSTDIQTFDGFIKELWAGVTPDLGFVQLLGWPHDTLTGIWNNARQLAELIHSAIGPRGPRIIFVCHSRGGLVARATALRLYQIDKFYRSALVGAITFGTPHEGASLAAATSGVALAHLVSIMAASSTGKIAPLSDILLYRSMQKNEVIQGVEDLRPPDSAGFISELTEQELQDDQKPEGRVRYLNMCCVGGVYGGPPTAAALLAARFFGKGDQHDLVVSLGSSIPRVADSQFTVGCAHGEYCSEKMRQSSGLRDAVGIALSWLRPPIVINDPRTAKIKPRER